jgi:hypothetical protein
VRHRFGLIERWRIRPRHHAAVCVVGALLLLGRSAPSAGQEGLPGECTVGGSSDAECLLAVASMRAVQERIGIALWGGNPVPGTASTLGMRLGSTPRLSASTRLALVPVDLPPLLDRTADGSRRGLIPGLAAQATVGLLQGWSPLPTVGGVLSLDGIGALAFAPLPRGHGFQNSAVAWSVGARVGLMRESFTLPGVSLTTSYGRSNAVALGDPASASHDGFARGAISDLNATLAASQRISALRITGGVAFDRYASRARIGYQPEAGGGERVEVAGRLTTDRRSWFANAAWTALIFHGIAEVGWQEVPDPTGLPAGVRVDPAGWWAALAFRVSI